MGSVVGMFLEDLMRKARVLLVLILSALMGSPIAVVAGTEPAKVAGKVIAVAGPVSVTRPEVAPHPLKFRDNLYWRDVVEARKEGIARILLGGKATVTVRELSTLELREEKQTEGVRYVVDLVSGKVRASVARMLMRPGDQVEVWTWNSVASVRGTDFIVESVERPAQAGAFGLLEVREVARAVADGGRRKDETVVVTLSGAVDVANRLGGTGQVARIGAYEAVRVSGNQDPVRFQINSDQLKVLLQGLTSPRPQEAQSGDQAEAVATKVESAALASAPSVGAFEQAGGGGGRLGTGNGDKDAKAGSLAAGLSIQSGAQGTGNGFAPAQVNGTGTGNGLALGQVNVGGNGNGLALGQSNLGKNVGPGNVGQGNGNQGNGNQGNGGHRHRHWWR